MKVKMTENKEMSWYKTTSNMLIYDNETLKKDYH